ncbi:MAG: phenylalanine--tRNA ligase subunit beta [Promethearchaeota archaeon]
MPAIELSLNRLSKLVGKECTVDDMELDLQWIGLDLDDVSEDIIKVEYNPNRPDFSSPEGIARALRGYYNIETGLPVYELADSNYHVNVDPRVGEVRPYIVTAIVKNVQLDEEEVATLMNVQEDLHWAIGRGRKKVAIGVHDLDTIEPPFRYTAVEPDSMKFEPLQMPGYELTPAEILTDHPKGVEFAHILKDASVYPMIFDKNDNVISFPPIINGTLTMVTDDTKNLFIDMTGTNFKAVNFALNVLCTMLSDMGCKVETCTNHYEDKGVVSPNFEPAKWTVEERYINSYLGLDLSTDEIIKAFNKVRFGATPSKKKGYVDVLVPPYRGDLLHPVDFTEEVAMGYGYSNLPTTLVLSLSGGQYHPIMEKQNAVRKLMIGLGFQEVVNFVLSNKEKSFGATRRSWKGGIVITNPVSKQFDTTRQDLVSGLIQNLQDNKHQAIPINIFEVGDCIILDSKAETGARRDVHLACVMYDSSSEYTKIRSVLDSFMEMYGVTFTAKAASNPFGMDGRTADIYVKNKRIGTIGEIHPEILVNFDLEFPATFLELNLELIG